MSEVMIVPEPKSERVSGKSYIFDGFSNFPEFLQSEFNLPIGKWKIEKVKGDGNGLRIADGKVQLWGDEKVSYATLVQLVKQFNNSLPELEVEESFKFSFRGYHLDIARGGVPNLNTFKDMLRWLFLLKYNYFGIYFEDLFPWEAYPDIGKHRGRLTRAELKEIVDYGKKLGVEVFPSLELTGHMEHILSLPRYQKFSEWNHPSEGCLDLSNEKAKKFAFDLLEEVVEFFPSKYIHIGGDETWALGRGKSLNKNWSFEGHKLYEKHYGEMIKIVKSHSKTPMIWGDMLTGMYLSKAESKKWQEVLKSEMWDEVVIANWDYSPKDVNFFKDKIGSFGRQRKDSQIACPGLSDWNTYYPNFEGALVNVKNFIDAAKEEELSGFLVTSWGDDGQECLFSFLNPLILATMEFAEGSGKWEKKWESITGEDKKITRVRKLFGDPVVSSFLLKRTLFSDLKPLYEVKEEKKKELKEAWEKILDESKMVNLDEDLEFVRKMIEVGLKKLNASVKVSDFVELANVYSRLWLSERKQEGLENVLTRFWGMAGMTDLARDLHP